MADAPAMPSLPPASAGDGDGDPPSPSAPVPRVLPSSMFLDTPPPSRGMAPRGPRGRGGGGRAAAASVRGGGGIAAAASGSGWRGGGGRGRTSALPAATSYGTGGSKPNRLDEAVMKQVPTTDGGARRLPSADVLDLAMAEGPLFEWLGYWPEKGFPKEDHPYFY